MSLTKATNSMILGASINVLDYGADPSGTSDSTFALQSAINAAIDSPTTGEVVLPYGRYLISAPLVLSSRPTSGTERTVALKITGLAVGGNAVNGNPRMYGALLIADSGFTGSAMLSCDLTAINLGFDGTQLEFENLTFFADGNAAKCIYINNAINVTFTRVTCQMPTDIGIHLDGANTYSVNFNDIYVSGGNPSNTANPANYAVKSTARFALYNRIVVDGCQTGIAASGDQSIITNCHLEGQARCVDISSTGGGYARVTQCLLNPYAAGQTGWFASGYAVYIEGLGAGAAVQNIIAHNSMASLTGTNPAAIYLKNTVRNVIQSNNIYSDTCIETDGIGGHLTVSNNILNAPVSGVAIKNNANFYVDYDLGNQWLLGGGPGVFSGTGASKVRVSALPYSTFAGNPEVTISTTATTIQTMLTTADAPCMLQVAGYDAGTAAAFCDLVMVAWGAVHVVSSNTSAGVPAARTYTFSSPNVRLAMASGSYLVRTLASQWQNIY